MQLFYSLLMNYRKNSVIPTLPPANDLEAKL